MITQSFRLTKVTRSGNTVRVGGVANDNRPDLYSTRMSLRLYQRFIERREAGEFEPYLSVSHYLHPVGIIDKLYIDGRYLKMTAEIDTTSSIGNALADRLADPEFRSQVAFSIGFSDEDYYYDETADGLLTYVDGLLIHVAFTTIPGNPRSRLISVEMRKAKSQYDDAMRLVGPVYAAYLDEENRRLKRTETSRLYCDHVERHGSHNQKSHGRGGAGSGIVRNEYDAESDSELESVWSAQREDMNVKGDPALNHIAAKRGYDGKPDVVDEATLDKHIQGGEVELFRGTKSHHADNFRDGPYYAGNGVHGNGIYTAGTTGGRNRNNALNEAEAYGPTVMRMSIKRDARIVDGESIGHQIAAFRGDVFSNPKATKTLLGVSSDPGRFAAIKGYDAIKLTNAGASDYYVILNRTALRVQNVDG